MLAYQRPGAPGSVHVVPQRLDPEAAFDVRSVEQGLLGTYNGRLLMQTGVEIKASPNTAAHVLLIEPAAATSLRKRP